MLLRNPDLASVLSDIGRRGINGFYRGEIAAAIAAAISQARRIRHGAGHGRPSLELGRDRDHCRYRDVVVHELPPPTQGLIALSLLKVLRDRTKAELQPGPEFVEMFRSARDTRVQHPRPASPIRTSRPVARPGHAPRFRTAATPSTSAPRTSTETSSR